jgi:hypothetical protein
MLAKPIILSKRSIIEKNHAVQFQLDINYILFMIGLAPHNSDSKFAWPADLA